MSSGKYYVSWDELYARCHAVAEQIKSSDHNFTKILAVTRGGAIPAGIIAYALNIKNVETISIETYGGKGDQEIGELSLIKNAQPEFFKDTLVIDDLVDTGTTFKHIREKSENCFFAAPFAKPKGKPMIDFYDLDIPQDTWIYFPWDVEPKNNYDNDIV